MDGAEWNVGGEAGGWRLLCASNGGRCEQGDQTREPRQGGRSERDQEADAPAHSCSDHMISPWEFQTYTKKVRSSKNKVITCRLYFHKVSSKGTSDLSESSHLFFFFLRFFLMWTIFKVFIEFVTILLLFYVLVLWLWGMGDLSSLTRDQTCTLCVRKGSLNHWTAREVPEPSLLVQEEPEAQLFANTHMISKRKDRKSDLWIILALLVGKSTAIGWPHWSPILAVS